MPTLRLRAALTLVLVLTSVPVLAAPSAGSEPTITWDQVRAGLPHPHPGNPGNRSAGTATLSIPDLSAAIDDWSAPAAVRRAACHQVTGLDDESAPPLAACLRHVAAGSPRR